MHRLETWSFAFCLVLAGCGGGDGGDGNGGPCPEADQELCGETCTDTQSDPTNCGLCAHACDQGQSCDGGLCVSSCEPPLDDCGGECVNVNADPSHCGDCETACAEGESCIPDAGGAIGCRVDCGPDGTACDATCVDTQTDPANCGDCGVVCGGGEVCSAGGCAATCADGTAQCGDSCVDLATDAGHCGSCDLACDPGVPCVDSACFTDGCAPGVASRQIFSTEMVGCAGTESFANRDTLCARGWTACSASAWVTGHGDQIPEYNYWTRDPLRYTSNGGYYYGGGFGVAATACWVDEIEGVNCGDATPMRICIPGIDPDVLFEDVFDRLGNECNWTDCGYEDFPPPNHYFGGCGGNLTAGTVCCPE